MNFMSKIIKEKRKEVEKAKKKRPLARFRSKLRKSKRNFRKALKTRTGFPALIAEIKRASPSNGIITDDFNVAEITKMYNKHASAISVLTDEKFFKGSLKIMKTASDSSKLPIIRKDFIIDEYQIYESRLYGADAVLLISNLLTKKKIDEFVKIASSLGMNCLVETESAAALKKVLDTKAEIVGINNRNLHSLKVDKRNTLKLLKLIPKNRRKKLTIVSESGIYSREDIDELGGKTDAILVGSSIMESENREMKVKELAGIPLVKICGVTNKKDALAAVNAGADFIGFNFYINTPRYIEPKKAKKIINSLPAGILSVGVFVNEPKEVVKRVSKDAAVDLIQFSGKELPVFVNSFKNGFKSLKIGKKADLKEINKYKSELILLEPFKQGLYGGTGKKLNTETLKEINKIRGKKILLAGGINPSNVKGILHLVQPYAIDVASGVESSPGKKSVSKMNELVRKVN